MRRAIACAVLVWWFALTSPSHLPLAGRVIGPFDNEQACNEIRDVFVRQGTGVTKCWHYGGRTI